MKEIKKNTRKEVFKFPNAVVIVERIKNDINGNPRYEVEVVDLEKLESHTYRFACSYATAKGIASAAWSKYLNKTQCK